MAAKKRGLGRGLDALLGQAARYRPTTVKPVNRIAVPDGSPAGTIAIKATDHALQQLPVDLIQRGKYQPRVDMHTETLQELADSISAQGVIQPIVVRGIGAGRYEIIAGERRWRAAQLAGLQEIPVVVRNVDDRDAIAISLIENIQRENLNPLEEARALKRLIEEFEMTHEQAAEAVGRSRAAVSNLLRLLDLEEAVKEMVDHGQLEMGHARALLSLSGKQQIEAAHKVVRGGLSVRATEHLVKQLSARRARTASAGKRDPDVQRLEARLSDTLGARVVLIQSGRSGKGKLEIHYNSLEELDGILEHIK